MKKCPNPKCNQSLGEDVGTCPLCGQSLEQPCKTIDDYELMETVSETSSGLFYRARKKETADDVMLRLYPLETNFSPEEVDRINRELSEISAFSNEFMVQHIALCQSDTGQWYRVTEWIETVSWGDLIASRFFRDPRNKKKWIQLFINIAKTLQYLHNNGRIIPQLTLNDLLLFKENDEEWNVKLDYKLSPIFNASQNDSNLTNHIAQHPDITSNRPLDQRSDIWTLGRLMVELLVGTNDFDDCQKLVDGIFHDFKPIVLHRKLSGLLCAMVQEDPDKRTSSMDQVIESLTSITDDDIQKWNKFEKDPSKKKKLRKSIVYSVGAAACIVVLVFGFLTFYNRQQTQMGIDTVKAETKEQLKHSQEYLDQLRKEIQGEKNYIEGAIAEKLSRALISMEGKLPEERITMLTERYRHSVGFVLTEYRLEYEEKTVASMTSTGTAFLVSSDGYLLTNRHVVCPWLKEDEKLAKIFEKAREKGVSDKLKLKYNLYLWFDGEEAFRTVAGLGSENIEDHFILSTSYRSDGTGEKKVEIMGVMPKPSDLIGKIYSLGNDVAVLRVSSLPLDAEPIPLQPDEKGKKVGKGTSVFAMGFPHGSKSIMGSTVVSRVTDGTITRVFENTLTTNADIHPGNSGGPVINMDGFAIGIASAIFAEPSDGKAPPQGKSSMGRIFPIQKARILLDNVRKGNPQWKGIPTYAFEGTLDKAKKAALDGNQEKASRMIQELIEESPHPDLFFWSGILSVRGDELTDQGIDHLKKNLTLEPENAFVKFLLYRADYLANISREKRAFRDDLLSLEWWNFSELLKYLVQMLEGEIPLEKALVVGDTPDDEAFIYWTAASLTKKEERNAERVRYLQKANDSVTPNSALQFLVHAEMIASKVASSESLRTSSLKKRSGEKTDEDLEELLGKILEQFAMPPEKSSLSSSSSSSSTRMALLMDIFDFTNKGLWQKALDQAERYLSFPNRESANMLGIGLLKCQLLSLLGQKQEAEAALKAYMQQIHAPLYRHIASYLLGESTEKELKQESTNSPEKTLTLSTALGLKAEAEGDLPKAIEYYNDAMDTGINNWAEFTLAVERRGQIRANQNK